MVNYDDGSGNVIAVQAAPEGQEGSDPSQQLHVLQTTTDGVPILLSGAPVALAVQIGDVQTTAGKSIPNVEDAMARLHEETNDAADSDGQAMKKELLLDEPAASKKSVSNLAMEWSDDDD